MHLTNGQLASPGARSSILGMANPAINNNLVQGGGVMNMVGLGAGAVTVATESPDGLGRSNGDMSSLSPVPYSFNGGLRGRRSSGTVEKVVERRQRRMIKNRESAARSRARKQVPILELEYELCIILFVLLNFQNDIGLSLMSSLGLNDLCNHHSVVSS